MSLSDLQACLAQSEALVHAVKHEVGEAHTQLSRRIREVAAAAEQHIELSDLVPLTILGKTAPACSSLGGLPPALAHEHLPPGRHGRSEKTLGAVSQASARSAK